MVHPDLIATPVTAAAALETIVRPRSVVVIGANEAEGKLTSGSVRNLLRHSYPGRLHVVNPNRREVYGVAAVPSLSDLPEVPDTAVIVLAAARAVTALRECAAQGITSATLVAAGFGEGGGHGARARDDLQAALRETGVRILGPNTAGLINLVDGYVPRASHNHPTDLVRGRVGVIAQSGGLCNTVVNRANANGVGIAMAVSTGNQVDLDLWDVGEYLLAQDTVDVIVTIIEGFGSPQKFVDFARHARERNKPVVALKLGRSEAGQLAVATHSGSVAGSADVQQAVLDDLNVITVDDLDELWEVASLVARWGAPARRVSRLGVITPSGGDGAIVADEATRLGLTVPAVSDQARAAYAEVAADVALANPFDTQAAIAVTGPDTVADQVTVAASDAAFDAVLLAVPVFATPEAVRTLDPLIAGLRRVPHVDVAVSAWSAGLATAEAVAVLRGTGWPTFDGSLRAVRAIARYDAYAARLETASSTPAALSVTDVTQRRVLPTYWSARDILGRLDVPLNQARLVTTSDAAVGAAAELGYPVTLKYSTREFTHKADAGALVQGVRDASEVRRVADRFLQQWPPDAADEGVVIEQHVYSSLPVFVGGHRDPEFGPVVLVGLGGAFTEQYADVARVPAPANRDRVSRALATTKVSALLRKYPHAQDTLVELVARLSRELHDNPTLLSFDINPLLVGTNQTLVAVDARVELSTHAHEDEEGTR